MRYRQVDNTESMLKDVWIEMNEILRSDVNERSP
jgi:hypothetical protein